jgi:hypothetical protein
VWVKAVARELTRYGLDLAGVQRVKTGGKTICSEIHELTNSIWNKEELPGEWKQSITVPIYKDGKTDCGNYRDMSLLSTTYKILSNILL